MLAALALMGSPGPATVSLAAVASTYGVRRSLPYLLGMIGGTALVLLAVATGVTAALLAVPVLRSALVGAAALYIIWLAFRIATARPVGHGHEAAAPSLAGAAVLAVANPKAWVALAAVFTSVRIADDPGVDAAAKVVVLSALLVVIMTTWLIAGASLAPVLRHPRRGRALNVALAVALVAATALALRH